MKDAPPAPPLALRAAGGPGVRSQKTQDARQPRPWALRAAGAAPRYPRHRSRHCPAAAPDRRWRPGAGVWGRGARLCPATPGARPALQHRGGPLPADAARPPPSWVFPPRRWRSGRGAVARAPGSGWHHAPGGGGAGRSGPPVGASAAASVAIPPMCGSSPPRPVGGGWCLRPLVRSVPSPGVAVIQIPGGVPPPDYDPSKPVPRRAAYPPVPPPASPGARRGRSAQRFALGRSAPSAPLRRWGRGRCQRGWARHVLHRSLPSALCPVGFSPYPLPSPAPAGGGGGVRPPAPLRRGTGVARSGMPHTARSAHGTARVKAKQAPGSGL